MALLTNPGVLALQKIPKAWRNHLEKPPRSLSSSNIQSDLLLKVALCEIIDLTVHCKRTFLLFLYFLFFEVFSFKGPRFLYGNQRNLSHLRSWAVEWHLNNSSLLFVKHVGGRGQNIVYIYILNCVIMLLSETNTMLLKFR